MDKVSIVPIWIIFPDLDPYLWTDRILNKLASRIGKPLFADHNTTSKDKLSFARGMEEVDVEESILEVITLNTPFGSTLQRVELEWMPFYCQCCGQLGHKDNT